MPCFTLYRFRHCRTSPAWDSARSSPSRSTDCELESAGPACLIGQCPGVVEALAGASHQFRTDRPVGHPGSDAARPAATSFKCRRWNTAESDTIAPGDCGSGPPVSWARALRNITRTHPPMSARPSDITDDPPVINGRDLKGTPTVGGGIRTRIASRRPVPGRPPGTISGRSIRCLGPGMFSRSAQPFSPAVGARSADRAPLATGTAGHLPVGHRASHRGGRVEGAPAMDRHLSHGSPVERLAPVGGRSQSGGRSQTGSPDARRARCQACSGREVRNRRSGRSR